MKFAEEDLQKYKEAYKTLSELMDVVDVNSGESWWALYGMNGYISCDMGYVFAFWSDLGSYLNEEEFETSLRPFSNLRYPPDFYKEGQSK